VLGTLFGTWFGTRQRMSYAMNFWFGLQGLEYVDLGRFWQLFLFVGLFVWLWLMGRALWPVLREPGPNRGLRALFFIASSAIALFYGAGLMRVIGNTVFTVGVLALGWFIAGLKTGWSLSDQPDAVAKEFPGAPTEQPI
jgi:nitric oxide reductase large subunit